MLDFINEHPALFWWLGIISAVMFVATLVVLPFLVVRIPEDYFVRTERPATPFEQHHPVVRIVLLILKNGIGAVFVLAGIAMLVLPGQGIITMLIGILLLDFPGKFRLERWIVSRKTVGRSINWMRRKAGHEPLQLPDGNERSVPEGT